MERKRNGMRKQKKVSVILLVAFALVTWWSTITLAAVNVEESSILIRHGAAELILSEDDATTLFAQVERLGLDEMTPQTVDQYYGKPTVPPGENYELAIVIDEERVVDLALVSELSAMERVIHRLNEATEDLDVFVLDTPEAMEAYDVIYSLVAERLYTQMIYAQLIAEPTIKVEKNSIVIDLTDDDREAVQDALFILLGNNLDLTDDKNADWDIGWRIPEAPLPLNRLNVDDTYRVFFGDDIAYLGLTLLPETVNEPAAIRYTDMYRSLTLAHDLTPEKQPAFDELLVFLSELFSN